MLFTELAAQLAGRFIVCAGFQILSALGVSIPPGIVGHYMVRAQADRRYRRNPDECPEWFILAQRSPSNSTSNFKVAPGGMTLPAPRSP